MNQELPTTQNNKNKALCLSAEEILQLLHRAFLTIYDERILTVIKHIVCFKLKDNSPEEVKKAAEILRSMEGNVPLLRGIEVGEDFLHSPRSYDIILQVKLDDKKALEEYQQDEYHCSVVKKHIHSVAKASVAVDYNI